MSRDHYPQGYSADVQAKIDAIMKACPELDDAMRTLHWIVVRIDEEVDRKLAGLKPQWGIAAAQCSNEASGELSRLREVILTKACRLLDQEHDAAKEVHDGAP